MTQSFAEDVTPRRGTKASVMNVGSHYTLDAAMPAGVIVAPAAEGHCVLPSTAALVAKALGVLAYDPVVETPTSTSYDFNSGECGEVVDDGAIWVVAESGLAVGDQPYCRFAAGAGGSQLGAVRADADTASAALLPNARVLAVTTGLAKVRVNLPHGAAA